MALRTAHGTARGGGSTLVVEVPPGDELHPLPGPVAVPQAVAGGGRAQRPGTFEQGGDAARSAGAKGGKRRALRDAARKAFAALNLTFLTPKVADKAAQERIDAHIVNAEDLRQALVTDLVDRAGGQLGPGPQSILASVALEQAAENAIYQYALELFATGDKESAVGYFAKAASIGSSKRQNLLGAHHLAALETRRDRGPSGGEAARSAAARATALLEAQRAAEEVAAE